MGIIVADFVDAVKALVAVDKDWVPSEPDTSLYIRPFTIATEPILGVKTILMGFRLEKNAIHSPNESMDLEVWENGIVAVTEFL